jgi:hypothetical protein
MTESTMNIRLQKLAFGIALTLFVTPVGCSTLAQDQNAKGDGKSFLDRMPWNKDAKNADPEPYPDPVKVAATWTPDTVVQIGRTPTRGFGGRVFFYDEKSRPVPVDGTLIVHGFDDAAETQENRIKRFEFTPEQFTRHFSQSDLGASYSVWIPWDAIGGQQRRISLVTSFQTAEGKMVQGVPATILLPGTSTEPTKESEVAKMSPQYQRYLKATRSGTSPSTGLTTTTIARRTPRRSSTITTESSDQAVPRRPPTKLIASGNTTPSAEISMIRQPVQPTVLPASAQVPVK